MSFLFLPQTGPVQQVLDTLGKKDSSTSNGYKLGRKVKKPVSAA